MFRSNLKQFLIYATGSMAQTALGFLLLPLYLRTLTPGEYGRVSILLTLNGAVSLLAASWVLSGLVRLYYDQTDRTRHEMAGTAIFWMTAATLIPAIVMFVTASSLSSVLFGKSGFTVEVRAASIFLCIATLPLSLCQVLRLEKHATAFVVISILGFLTDFTLKIYLIGVRRLGVEGYFISSILSSALMTVTAAGVVSRVVRLSLNRNLLRKLLTFGFPFLFTGFGMWILDISDRLILNAFAGPEPVGIYTLAYKFASIFNIVLLGPLSLFWSPFLFSYSAEQGEEATRRMCSQSFTLFVLPGSLLFVIIASGGADLIRLFSRNTGYDQASGLIPFLCLAPFLYMISFPAGSAILQSRQVRYSGYAVGVAALVNLALNLLLVPRFSFYGATATTVIGYGVLCSLQYFWAQRLFRTTYHWMHLIKTMGCSGLAILVAMQIHLEAPGVSLLAREITALMIFVLTAYLIGSLRNSNLKYIQELFSRGLSRLSVTSQEVSP